MLAATIGMPRYLARECLNVNSRWMSTSAREGSAERLGRIRTSAKSSLGSRSMCMGVLSRPTILARSGKCRRGAIVGRRYVDDRPSATIASSLIRGKYVICKVTGRHDALVIEDGAVFQDAGTIVDVGAYSELARRYRADETLGSPEHVVLPGFVNGHHHLGITPLQTGSPDLPLELWWASRLAKRDVDIYLDTLHSAFEMIECGITTVQHLQSRASAPLARIEQSANDVIRAYEDIGMRVSYSYGMREQNRLVYEDDEKFVGRLPPDLAPDVARLLSGQAIRREENFELFESLHRQHAAKERVRIQLSPTNLHWCTDAGLRMAQDYAERYRVPLHVHLLETMFQKEYARRRTGTTA